MMSWQSTVNIYKLWGKVTDKIVFVLDSSQATYEQIHTEGSSGRTVYGDGEM